jgi:hypothetical protein
MKAEDRTPDAVARVFDFDDVPIAIASSSSEVTDAIERMMTLRARVYHDPVGAIRVTAELTGDLWQILVDDKMVRGLPKSSVPPLVAEELIATACAAAARRQRSILIRGAVLEKDGVGLALIGDDLDSAKALALHLHARRWSAISFGYSFLNPKTLDIVGLQSLAAVSSTSIDQIPRRYRRAIEASKWYDAGYHLTFYAVDPYLVHPDHALSTTLKTMIVIDGDIDETASVQEAFEVRDVGFLENHPMAGSIRIAKMTLGTPIASCDAIEQWFASSRTLE